MSPQALLGSSLLGPGSRWKIASEPFAARSRPSEEESVAAFVRRKFGHEILEYLVAPFVSGVYAGDPEKLSLRAAFPTLEEWERQYGSVLRGAMKSRPPKEQRTGAPPLCSFARGVATLPRTMAAKLGEPWRTICARCRSIPSTAGAATDGAAYEIRIVRNGQEEYAFAAAVVMATPAYAASHLLESFSPRSRTLFPALPTRPLPWLRRATTANSRRPARRLRLSGPAQRKTSHARHGVEFVALPRPRARRQRRHHQFHRRRDRSRDHGDARRKSRQSSRRKCADSWNHRTAGRVCRLETSERRCRNTIWATGTSWKQSATRSAKLPAYFSPEIISKARRSGNASSRLSDRGSSAKVLTNPAIGRTSRRKARHRTAASCGASPAASAAARQLRDSAGAHPSFPESAAARRAAADSDPARHSHIRGAGVPSLAGQNIFREHFHAHFHGSVEHAIHARFQHDEFAHRIGNRKSR